MSGKANSAPSRDPSQPKVCSSCGVEKQPSDFHLQAGRLRSRCKECAKQDRKKVWDRELANAARWRDKNRDRVLAALRSYHERNREKRNAYSLRYNEANRERLAEYGRNWARQNKDLSRAAASRRRAALLQATPAWGDELTRLVTAEAADLAQRRESEFGFAWHIDHEIPLRGRNVCGLHVWNNLQVIPASVNIRKTNRFMPDGIERNWL